MELVGEDFHKAVAHKGSAAERRAAGRIARTRAIEAKGARRIGGKGQGATSGAIAVLSVYMTTRDALQAAGILQPNYTVVEREDFHFVAADNSVFIVYPSWLWRSAMLEFVAGPRKGQTIDLTDAQADQYRQKGEEQWGKYIPGTLFSGPRFIPGVQKKSVPFFIFDHDVPQEAGWIDEKGVHRYSIPKPART